MAIITGCSSGCSAQPEAGALHTLSAASMFQSSLRSTAKVFLTVFPNTTPGLFVCLDGFLLFSFSYTLVVAMERKYCCEARDVAQLAESISGSRAPTGLSGVPLQSQHGEAETGKLV